MLFAFLLIFAIAFAYISWKKIEWGLALLFLLLPTYLIRFHIGPLPSTMLEIMIWIIVGVWIGKEIRNWKLETRGNKRTTSLISNFLFLVSNNKLLTTGIFLFLVAATVSIFTSLDIRAAAGEWKAFYVEPVLIFLVIISVCQLASKPRGKPLNWPTDRLAKWLLLALIFCGLVTSLLAIYQHFTGFLVPHAFWANRNTYRVTGWYGFPNAVGLFLAPLIPLALYLIKENYCKLKNKNWQTAKLANWQLWITLISNFLFLASSIFAILFAKSTGGLIGVAASIGLLLLFSKKTRWTTVVIGFTGLIALIILPAQNPLKQELTFQDRSWQIRIAMWKEAAQVIKERPILGAGLASYTKRVVPYHKQVNGENIEIFHHQHNIFLTMWVNLGLTGLIGFILILVWFYKTGIRKIRKDPTPIPPLPIFLLSSMTALLVTGLVDSPYIKNDLSLFFWLLIALMFVSKEQLSGQLEIRSIRN